jgi:hypothetical protein
MLSDEKYATPIYLELYITCLIKYRIGQLSRVDNSTSLSYIIF